MKDKGKTDRAILLSIETKVREFPGKVLLACQLAERGFRVVFTNDRSAKEALRHGAWLFVDRNTFANRIPFFRKLKRLRVKIACLDEEGIVWAHPGIYLKRLNAESLGMMDLFLTWGRKQTELVRQVGGGSRIRETGNPRMDLLRPELRSIYRERAEAIKASYGDFILIASNFAWNNHFYVRGSESSPVEGYVRLLRRQGFITCPEDEEYHRANLAYKAKVFERLKELVLRLGRESPELKIVVRPHPSENHESWKAAMAGLPNIQVVFEGELEAWIMAARAVIHNSCTSGLIAALLNLKSIAYMPYEDLRFEHELPNDASAKAYSEEEVIELVRKSPIHQEVPGLLDEYISALKGPLATERIADEIAALYAPAPMDGLMARAGRFLSLFMKQDKTKGTNAEPRSADGSVVPARKKSRSYRGQKFGFIAVDEVKELMDIYRKMLGKFGDVNVRENDGSIEVRQECP